MQYRMGRVPSNLQSCSQKCHGETDRAGRDSTKPHLTPNNAIGLDSIAQRLSAEQHCYNFRHTYHSKKKVSGTLFTKEKSSLE